MSISCEWFHWRMSRSVAMQILQISNITNQNFCSPNEKANVFSQLKKNSKSKSKGKLKENANFSLTYNQIFHFWFIPFWSLACQFAIFLSYIFMHFERFQKVNFEIIQMWGGNQCKWWEMIKEELKIVIFDHWWLFVDIEFAVLITI